jgi:hypothetical protein
MQKALFAITLTLAGITATEAAARCTAYLPPKTGVTVSYFTRGTEHVTGGKAEKVALSRHATIEKAPGDDVIIRYRDPRVERRDKDEETYLVTFFRGLWAYASSFGGQARMTRKFNRETLADLWPLLPGKRIKLTATDTLPAAVGKPALTIGRTELTIEVEGEETIRTQAGRFSTCVLLVTIKTWRLETPDSDRKPYTRLAVTETRKIWLAPKLGIAVKDEKVLKAYGLEPGSGVKSEERVTTSAVWVKGD